MLNHFFACFAEKRLSLEYTTATFILIVTIHYHIYIRVITKSTITHLLVTFMWRGHLRDLIACVAQALPQPLTAGYLFAFGGNEPHFIPFETIYIRLGFTNGLSHSSNLPQPLRVFRFLNRQPVLRETEPSADFNATRFSPAAYPEGLFGVDAMSVAWLFRVNHTILHCICRISLDIPPFLCRLKSTLWCRFLHILGALSRKVVLMI